MSYRDFEEAIASSRLRTIAQHWSKVRGTRKMPGWADISPFEISEHLPIVFSYSYDPKLDEFFGRLAGNAIAGISNGAFKGASLSSIRPPERYPHAFARAKKVVSEGALYRGIGQVYDTGDKKMFGERIVLPLASNGTTPDGIFGAADYQVLAEYHPAAQDMTSETESWFTL